MARFPSDPGNPGKKPRRSKPAIWAAGVQRPRLDMQAFFRVTQSHARRVAARGLAAAAAALGRFAARVFAGEVRLPEQRLGQVGRMLPPHRNVGRSLDSTARLVAEAARRAAGSEPTEPLVFRGWNADSVGIVEEPVVTVTVAPTPLPVAVEPPPPPPPPPKPAKAAAAAEDADRATLEAIRNLIHATEIEPKRPGRAKPKAEPPPPRSANLPDLAPMEPVPPGPVFRTAGAVLGIASVIVIWPVSLMRSGWMAARGVDLRLVD